MKTKYLLPLLLLLLFNVIGGAAQNAKTDKPKRTVMLGQIVRDSFTGVRLKAHVTLMRQDSTVSTLLPVTDGRVTILRALKWRLSLRNILSR